MDDILTERAGSILRVQLNRPTKRNAMTSAMYLSLAAIVDRAAKDEATRVVLWHGDARVMISRTFSRTRRDRVNRRRRVS